ncbi:pyrroline-5-carboxylate reductase [Olsenella sp. KH1P3]|uniref:Pyrroline-5-carboxylate reductase n=2 Tax=Coriobacteriales TaxID=84999 RepID=A0A1H9NGA2_9ACTN|nr:pyrroline-5-carboxylate reductase [Parafannyhessea umbonata]SER34980.1 pyrroline-5-carboxylate reductase [Parafannyhessea umbonata]SJZ47135.1 pyrroline-5-carboxylate reductase [Olsenella sp. KH1P3]
MRMLEATVAVIGAGSMGGAIAAGLVNSGCADPSRVMACDHNDDKLAALSAKGVRTFPDAGEMLACDPDVVVLAIKPQVLRQSVEVVRAKLAGKLVVSIAAGVSIATLEEMLSDSRVVRVMPNLPVQALSGASALCRGNLASDADMDVALQIFGALGSAKVMREDQLDAEGAVVGCGPAYVALMVDALTRSGVEKGLPAQACREMVLSTMRGVCDQLLESGEHPRAYMEKVTSPGGTTAAGLRELEPALIGGVQGAIDAALRRTVELAGE